METPPKEYYTHDAGCSKDNYWPTNARGLKTCKDCAGIFDKDGKGVAITDKRFDAEYYEHKAEVEADQRGENI